jgi:hypothetical protein
VPSQRFNTKDLFPFESGFSQILIGSLSVFLLMALVFFTYITNIKTLTTNNNKESGFFAFLFQVLIYLFISTLDTKHIINYGNFVTFCAIQTKKHRQK